MDSRNVIVFRSYPHIDPNSMTLCVDEQTREALGVPFGQRILAHGRRTVTAVVEALNELDQDGRMARVTPALLTALMVDYGEDLLLSTD